MPTGWSTASWSANCIARSNRAWYASRHGAANADKNCPFSALPDECVRLVLRQLEVLQLLEAACVCRRWRACAKRHVAAQARTSTYCICHGPWDGRSFMTRSVEATQQVGGLH